MKAKWGKNKTKTKRKNEIVLGQQKKKPSNVI